MVGKTKCRRRHAGTTSAARKPQLCTLLVAQVSPLVKKFIPSTLPGMHAQPPSSSPKLRPNVTTPISPLLIAQSPLRS